MKNRVWPEDWTIEDGIQFTINVRKALAWMMKDLPGGYKPEWTEEQAKMMDELDEKIIAVINHAKKIERVLKDHNEV